VSRGSRRLIEGLRPVDGLPGFFGGSECGAIMVRKLIKLRQGVAPAENG
jgi:hypothetical protein